ncbi:unnamed protein product [Protopolystoma xenopodis]|uniref:Uncharacterized protein n=1 Tax=Protopolystoma xenopodis TaxID=117903 RepID=A0A3S5B752_9PLAT|nr:unnamed protein product [Protopolystoma xenopodis]
MLPLGKANSSQRNKFSLGPSSRQIKVGCQRSPRPLPGFGLLSSRRTNGPADGTSKVSGLMTLPFRLWISQASRPRCHACGPHCAQGKAKLSPDNRQHLHHLLFISIPRPANRGSTDNPFLVLSVSAATVKVAQMKYPIWSRFGYSCENCNFTSQPSAHDTIGNVRVRRIRLWRSWENVHLVMSLQNLILIGRRGMRFTIRVMVAFCQKGKLEKINSRVVASVLFVVLREEVRVARSIRAEFSFVTPSVMTFIHEILHMVAPNAGVPIRPSPMWLAKRISWLFTVCGLMIKGQNFV